MVTIKAWHVPGVRQTHPSRSRFPRFPRHHPARPGSRRCVGPERTGPGRPAVGLVGLSAVNINKQPNRTHALEASAASAPRTTSTIPYVGFITPWEVALGVTLLLWLLCWKILVLPHRS